MMQKKRIQQARRKLRVLSRNGAMIISSGGEKTYSRDRLYPYRQHSDFFYLTGSNIKNATLVILADEEKPFLYAPKQSELSILWEGKEESASTVARKIGAKAVTTENSAAEIRKALSNYDLLAYQNTEKTIGWKLAHQIIALPSHKRGSLPQDFTHSDTILEEMRLYKDKEEIQQIKKAAKITEGALDELDDIIQPGLKEYQVAAMIEYHYKMQGGDLAFDTIAATGASAATLHYHEHNKTLKNGEMILVDTGASWNNYCSDVTRVFSVGESVSTQQQELYVCVLEAQETAIRKIKHNVKIATVYDAAAKVLTEGLKEFGVLKGTVSSLMKKQSYKKYFPHGIGHSLGIDVHDIGKLRANNDAVLKKGMVLTVEPGLYFPKKVRRIEPCGIRIEDDILVTAKGHENLTKTISK